MGCKNINKEVWAYGFPLYKFNDISLNELMEKFYYERRFHQIGRDYLMNNCQPIIDADRNMILTGCHRSAAILQKLTGITPIFVIYQISGYVTYLQPHLFEICFHKGGFIF